MAVVLYELTIPHISLSLSLSNLQALTFSIQDKSVIQSLAVRLAHERLVALHGKHILGKFARVFFRGMLRVFIALHGKHILGKFARVFFRGMWRTFSRSPWKTYFGEVCESFLPWNVEMFLEVGRNGFLPNPLNIIHQF
jgi:hypothetical protein